MSEKSRAFFDALFPDLAESFIEFRLIPRATDGKVVTIFCRSVDHLFDVTAPHREKARDRHVFFGACARRRKRGDKASISQVYALWADLDGKNLPGGKQEALEILRSFPLLPSFIVDSGNGFHAYWLFREPERIDGPDDVARIEKYLKELALRLGGDMAAAELARVLRVPGTFNVKNPDAPLLCKIVSADPNRRYNLCDFDEYFDIQPAAPVSASVVVPSNPPGWEVDVLDSLRPSQRHAGFTKLVGKLHSLGLKPELIYALLRPHAETANTDGQFPPSELEGIVRDLTTRYRGGQPKANAGGFIPDITSAADLLVRVFPPARFVIPGLLPEGLYLLCGKPKLGKSWLALAWCASVALGGKVLGSIPVERGEALYLALEDNEIRLQTRLRKLLDGSAIAEQLRGLDVVTKWPRLHEGGLDLLRNWLVSHPEARLIVVDTLARVRPPQKSSANIYQDDYLAMEGLKALADEFHVAVVVIHHTRKSSAIDILDEVSGTTGLTGATDGTIILKRERSRADAELRAIARDLENDVELALRWDKLTAQWISLGGAEEFRQSQARSWVVEIVRANGGSAKASEIAEALADRGYKGSRGAVYMLLTRMVKEGELMQEKRGVYKLARESE
jgi:hypothetical protein